MARKLDIEPQQLKGFAPDLDPSTPGIFQDCNNVIPTLVGFKAAPSPVSAGLPALSSPVLGSALIARLDGTDRQFAGTATGMFENVGSSWVEQSRSGGYNLGTSSQWRFAAFGNESLAVNGVDVLQTTLDGKFTNVPVSIQDITITKPGKGYTSAPTVTIAEPDLLTGIRATATAISSGTLDQVTITSAGVGYSYAPAVIVSGSNGDGTAVVQSTISAAVSRVTVAAGSAGSGYVTAPTVSITGGGGTGAAATAIIGTQATATAAITSGAVTGVTLNAGPWSSTSMLGATNGVLAGAGYTVVPTVTFSAPSTGTTATGTASVVVMPGGYFALTGIAITNAGSGYTTAPTVTIAAPTTVGMVVGFAVTSSGSGYNSVPTVALTGGSAAVEAQAFASTCGVVIDTDIASIGAGFTSNPTLTCSPPAINQAVFSVGIGSDKTLKYLTIVNPGSGYTTAPTITITGGGATTNATATCTINSGGFVSGITITNAGAGYTSVPTLTVSGPTVSAATATMTVTTKQALTGIQITNAGSGYTKTPVVSISGGGVADENQATAKATIVQAPVGKIIFVANGQVFVCNCSLPQQVAAGDFWFASGIYDHTQWDYTNQQTLCAYGQLIDTPGPITAGTSLGPNAILFKSNSMYFGTQTGYPIGWEFQAVSKNVGAPCQEAVVNTGTSLFFIGPDDFYAYQGNGLPAPIGHGVRRWFFNTLNPSYKDKMSSFYDQDQRVIYWGFVSNQSESGDIDTCIAYNWTTNTWGRINLGMQGFVQILNGQITYNGLGELYTDWDNLPNVSFDSSFWINFRLTPGYFDTSNTLQALAGTSNTATITTCAFGDDMYYTGMQQFRMRFKQEPTSGTALWQGRTTLGLIDPTKINTQNTGPFVVSDARFDVDYTARWHNLIISFDGDFEMLQWYPVLVKRGSN